ncbi:MAG: acyl-CoA desaturase [Flavobacteriales bacterium]|nr:acyl-CoA desaturase [Flavobacteriales bacterium]
MLAIYLVPFILMLNGTITSIWAVLLAWGVMGLGMSGIGMSVMHDANHGSYSKNKRVNQFIGYIMNMIGGHDKMWRLKHNVLHHTYTNIDGADEDIEMGSLFRFSPNQERQGMHRYQHIYAWPLYSLMSLLFATYADFSRLVRYKKKGVIRSESEFKKLLWDVSLWKVAYYMVFMVLPMLIAPISPWLIVLGFLIMHLVCGFLLSAIFQAAHVMPECEFPEPDEKGRIDAAWAVHQLRTTTNFAPKSRLFSWFIGGLNYQVEHHLFSNICHIHYPNLSKIVRRTAEEYGIPYKVEGNFVQALRSHGRLLRNLGKSDQLVYS